MLIWLPTTKSWESPWFTFMQVAWHIGQKAINKGYNFTLNLTSIGGLHKKLWASKVVGVSILKFLELLTWESQEKWHMDVPPMANHKKYYNEEGGGFPQIWAIVSLMSLCMPMVHLCPKSVQTMH
jgi:hypothetical protein